MGESTGDKGEPQIVARCLFATSAACRRRSRSAALWPDQAEHEVHLHRAGRAARGKATKALAMIDKLEQDEDVQNVYHSLV
jgi:transcriptional/translational regulatory protein YebC/TACO1